MRVFMGCFSNNFKLCSCDCELLICDWFDFILKCFFAGTAKRLTVVAGTLFASIQRTMGNWPPCVGDDSCLGQGVGFNMLIYLGALSFLAPCMLGGYRR